MIRFDHFNFNVYDREKSIEFYKKALDFKVIRERVADDDSFILTFMGEGEETTPFRLELTWLRDRKEPYNLGDLEYHLAIVTDQFDELYKRHQEMGCVCYENKSMGIYFINDPDGYWIEIIPKRD